MKHIIMILILSFSLFGCAKPAMTTGSTPTKDADYMVAIDSPSIRYLPFYLALEDNSFSEHGLDVGIIWDEDDDRTLSDELLTGRASFAIVDPAVWMNSFIKNNAKVSPVLLGKLTKNSNAFIYEKDKNPDALTDVRALTDGEIYVNSNDLVSYASLLYVLDVFGIDSDSKITIKSYENLADATENFLSADNSQTNCFLLTNTPYDSSGGKLALANVQASFAGDLILTAKPLDGAFAKKTQAFLDALQSATAKCRKASPNELANIAKKYIAGYDEQKLEKIIGEYQALELWTDNLSLDKDAYYATLFMLEGAGAKLSEIFPYETTVNAEIARQSSLK